MNLTNLFIGGVWSASAIQVIGYIWESFKQTYRPFPVFGGPTPVVAPPNTRPRRPRERKPRNPRQPPLPKTFPVPVRVPVPHFPPLFAPANPRGHVVGPQPAPAPTPGGPQPGSPWAGFPGTTPGGPTGQGGPSIDLPGGISIPLPPLPDFGF